MRIFSGSRHGFEIVESDLCIIEKYAPVLGNKAWSPTSLGFLAFGIGNLGGPDLFIILLIVLVLFGAKKLPDLARSLGQSMNEFRKAREDIDRELHNTGAQPSRSRPCQSAEQVAAVPSAQQMTPETRAL
jgi:sec-independent protein translocase protein TatA